MKKQSRLIKLCLFLMAIAPSITTRACGFVWGEPELPQKLMKKN